jgi:hypothetical protein
LLVPKIGLRVPSLLQHVQRSQIGNDRHSVKQKVIVNENDMPRDEKRKSKTIQWNPTQQK